MKRPLNHALLAIVYISSLSGLFYFMPTFEHKVNQFLGPIFMLSLFTLSAAVMGYLFVGEPLKMYIDGKKKEAVKFFFQTVGSFAVITAMIFIIAFFTSAS